MIGRFKFCTRVNYILNLPIAIWQLMVSRWINHQRNLDLASRLLAEGRYTVTEFLACTKHVTPNFGIVRPMHIAQPLLLSEIQPVVENRQPVNAREFILELLMGK